MAPKVSKKKHFELYRQTMDLRLAIGILSVFGLLVAAYLVAGCSNLMRSITVPIESPAASVTRGLETTASVADSEIKQFRSQDDFKSYIDDGKRLYGDGIFETQNLTPLAQAGKQALSAAPAAKTAKAAAVPPQSELDPVTARNYFSLKGGFDANNPDIAQINKTNIYFSPDNQYYPEAYKNGGSDEFPGQTRVINAFPADTIEQSETIPADGDVLLAGNSLIVFLGNSLVAYNSDAVFGRQEMWRDRINEGGEIVGTKLVNGELYVAVKTAIDDVNPCPLKPISAGDEAYLVRCDDIYHPKGAILADSVISMLHISPATGKIEKSLSFVAKASNAAVIFSDDGLYTLWGEGGDYVTFFSDFLNDKCKSLLPNYILEKTANLGSYNISLLAKEMELRSILMNWLATLNADEQARIIGEIKTRMADYMSGNYRMFESTRVAKIDPVSFKFIGSRLINGLIPDASFADNAGGNLRVMTVAGGGVAKKMNWLVTGQTSTDTSDQAVDNVYVIDGDLKAVYSAERLNIGGGVCAVRYASDIAYASSCSGGQLYVINLAADENVGLASALAVGTDDFYIYPFRNRELLIISKNKRNINMAIYDNALAAKPEKKSEYSLNDYWADFDSNYKAFAADDENKLFFVPAGKGGYIFFHNGGNIELQKNAGSMIPSRAYLKGGMLYILSDEGIEVFGAPEWSQIGKLPFKN